MDAVFRALATYVFLFIMFRISGRRTIGDMSPFDLVLLLIVGEATQNALLRDDESITNAWLVITTLIGADIFLTMLKNRWQKAERILDGVPTVLLRDGELNETWMKRARVGRNDILTAARERYGIGSLELIDHAVLEPDGKITIVPKQKYWLNF